MRKTLIITGPDRAKEINPLGETVEDALPKGSNDGSWNNIIGQYKEAESSLKEYRIIGIYEGDRFIRLNRIKKQLSIGSINEAEVNEEKQTCILYYERT